jgi:hypothetical protein
MSLIIYYLLLHCLPLESVIRVCMYIRINYTKAPALDPSNFSEPRLQLIVGRVCEVL